MHIYDMIIAGAGPAGISAAYSAKKYTLDYLVLERAAIAQTIQNYPLGKPLFSTPNELEFEPGTLRPVAVKPTREEVLDYYLNFISKEQLKIRTDEAVVSIKAGSPLIVKTTQDIYASRSVLIAIGGMGVQNRLNVPGETPERVSYLFHSAAGYAGKHVLVVGGGNSAAEGALYLEEGGAEVTLSMRRQGIDPEGQGATIKPWVKKPLLEAAAEGRIEILYNSKVLEIRPETVLLQIAQQVHERYCDRVFALIGARPDTSLLEATGIPIASDGRPEYDPETYETAISNIFVAGHLTRQLHMKNAISIPPQIVDTIARRLGRA